MMLSRITMNRNKGIQKREFTIDVFYVGNVWLPKGLLLFVFTDSICSCLNMHLRRAMQLFISARKLFTLYQLLHFWYCVYVRVYIRVYMKSSNALGLKCNLPFSLFFIYTFYIKDMLRYEITWIMLSKLGGYLWIVRNINVLFFLSMQCLHYVINIQRRIQ